MTRVGVFLVLAISLLAVLMTWVGFVVWYWGGQWKKRLGCWAAKDQSMREVKTWWWELLPIYSIHFTWSSSPLSLSIYYLGTCYRSFLWQTEKLISPNARLSGISLSFNIYEQCRKEVGWCFILPPRSLLSPASDLTHDLCKDEGYELSGVVWIIILKASTRDIRFERYISLTSYSFILL